jgi:hypothetical protein
MRTLLMREDLGRPFSELHRKTLRAMAKRGEIPTPVRIGVRDAWYADEWAEALAKLPRVNGRAA